MKHAIILYILLIFSCFGNKSQQINQERMGIPLKSPVNLNIDTSILNDLTQKLNDQFYPNIHSVLIIKSGFLVYEEYFSGIDVNYGRDLGLINHADSTLHDLRSISKSIVSALIGICIDKGFVLSVDQKISDFFPEFAFEGEKATWTIEHFLSMTTGLQWNEDVPYNNPNNDEIQMTYKEDPIKYVLNKFLENSPGTKFNYNGGATQVLAEIIERSSKKPLDIFVQKNLFEPLGIQNFEWNKYSIWGGAEKFAAPSGLRLTSLDMAKIGLLYRDKGMWKGKNVLNPKWVKATFEQRMEFPSAVSTLNDGYGYQFWMWPAVMLGENIRIVAAMGNGDQNIFWDLENDLIVVTTAGNYNLWDIENNCYSILVNHIYPAVGFHKSKKSRIQLF